MKVTRLNLVLLGLTVALFVLVPATAERGNSGTTDERAFAAFDASTILRVSLTDRKREGVEPLVLVRDSSDDVWKVEARGAFPAEAFPLELLFARITNLLVQDQVAEAEGSLALFGLAPGMGLGVELSSPGAAPWKFVVGAPGGAAGGFLRTEGESRIFDVPGYVGLSCEPRQWIQPKLFAFDTSAVRRVELTLAGEALVLERDDKGIWRETQTGRVAPRVALEDLIGDLSAMVLHDLAPRGITAKEAGFGADGLQLELLAADGTSLAGFAMVLSQRADEEGRGYVKKSAWAAAGHPEWIGLVSASLGDSVMAHVTAVLMALGGGG